MRRLRDERGFTLMEVLAVIIILGVLAAVGVYALAGVRDSGREKACATDVATLRTAAEAYYAKTAPSAYGNETALVADGVLGQRSSMHNVTVGSTQAAAASASNAEGASATGAAYAIKIQDASCGTVGQVVG